MRKKCGFFTQFIRHLIQIAAFILFPGLFIMVFSAVRDILTAFMEGSFSTGALFQQLILVFMVFLITALWGRFFCGYLCSFGMLQELIFFLSKRVISGKVRISERFDSVMKFLKYFILAFIVAGEWILALPVDSSWDPWGVFGILVSGNLSLISSAMMTAGIRRQSDTCTNCGLCTRACSMGIRIPEKMW